MEEIGTAINILPNSSLYKLHKTKPSMGYGSLL